jgi:hypothetical protein
MFVVEFLFATLAFVFRENLGNTLREELTEGIKVHYNTTESNSLENIWNHIHKEVILGSLQLVPKMNKHCNYTHVSLLLNVVVMVFQVNCAHKVMGLNSSYDLDIYGSSSPLFIILISVIMSQDSSAGYGPNGERLIPSRGRDLSILHHNQTGFGDHLAFCPTGIRACYPRG